MLKSVLVENHNISYRDVGTGDAVVIVHGTPSSSEEFLGLIEQLIPSIRVTRLAKVGHFVADEAPELVAPILRDFWSQSPSTLS